jgi:hypothetical protein
MFDLDWLIHDYLESVNGRPPITWSDARETWDRDILHVTDLNACPRAGAYRLRGEKEEPRGPQDSRKFVLANFQHELIYQALDFGGHLIDKEVPVPLPDGWTGTADMVLTGFYDSSAGGVNVGDSKNPVAGAKKYIAEYPKKEDIRQVSVYSRLLSEKYPELEMQDEGQAFYLPLGGASEWVPRRFDLLDLDEIEFLMDGLTLLVRESLPDPLPLGLYWDKRRLYTRRDGSTTVSGDIMHGTDWRCRYCRYDCPNREAAKNPERLCHTSRKGLENLSTLGRHMADEIEDFIRSGL